MIGKLLLLTLIVDRYQRLLAVHLLILWKAVINSGRAIAYV
jgi:hypothetical protein